LLDKLHFEWSRLEEALAQLTPEQMQQPSVDQAWSVKDILAHLTAWDERGMTWITAAVQGESPAIPAPGLTWDDAPSLNELTYQTYCETPLDVVMATWRQMHERLVNQIEALSEADLRKRVKGQPKGGPGQVSTLIRWRYRHLREHRQPIAAFVKAVALDDPSTIQPATVFVEAAPPPAPSSLPSLPSLPHSPLPTDLNGQASTSKYVVGHRIADMHQDERPRERGRCLRQNFWQFYFG